MKEPPPAITRWSATSAPTGPLATLAQSMTAGPLLASSTLPGRFRSIAASPAVANGKLYIGFTNGKLYAFDVTKHTYCSGDICNPLFTALNAGDDTSSPAIANGIVYNGPWAFDANGCSGTPVVCAPLFTAPIYLEGSPTVIAGTLYVITPDAIGDNHLLAFSL